MAGLNQLVVFSLDQQRFALNLTSVERIVRAVEITRLPDAPETILGVIDIEGRVIPVVNSRRCLGVSERDIELQDLFIIVNEAGRTVALVADEVNPVIEMPENEFVSSDRMLPMTGFVDGVAKLDEGMIIMLNVDKVLSFEHRERLHYAIEGTHEARNV